MSIRTFILRFLGRHVANAIPSSNTRLPICACGTSYIPTRGVKSVACTRCRRAETGLPPKCGKPARVRKSKPALENLWQIGRVGRGKP